MKSRVNIYKGADDEYELEIKINSEKLRVVNLENGHTYFSVHFPVCDLCCNQQEVFTFFPELGQQVLCDECARSHKKRVKWYTEDTTVVFNSLLNFVITYCDDLTGQELDTIDDYFRVHGHSEIKIRNFIGKFGKEE